MQSYLLVLESGVASLSLLQSEQKVLSQHYKETLQNLQKLYQLTPEPVVFFLAGSLPFSAHLHMRQLGLFGMLARCPENILHSIAEYTLTHLPDSSNSWFINIKQLCHMYALPHPLLLLQNPPEKEAFDHAVKLSVLEFWQEKLRVEARKLQLTSLYYFKPDYMSLCKPHPLWTTCGASSYEINKACVQAKYLSGRFRTDTLLSHFSKDNSVFCQLHPDEPEVGDLMHHLVLCPTLAERKALLFQYWDSLTTSNPPCREIINTIKLAPIKTFLQFILDCSVLPDVILARQEHGEIIVKILFKATRTYCYAMYRERKKRLDKWL